MASSGQGKSSGSNKKPAQKNTSSFLQQQSKPGGLTMETTWSALKPGVEQIYRKESMPKQQYMGLYNTVYQYCTSTFSMPTARFEKRYLTGTEFAGETLYDSLKKYLSDHIQNITVRGVDKRDETLLTFYGLHWKDFTFCSDVVHHIFLYLNRHWVRRELEDGNKDVYEIYSLCLIVWRDVLLGSMLKHVTDGILNLIKRERDGDIINTNFITCVVSSYVDLGLDNNPHKQGKQLKYYKDNLEDRIVEETKKYYTKESTEYLMFNSVTLYLSKAETRLNEEKQRVERYMEESTNPTLIKACEDVLILNHLTEFNEEFQLLLNNNKEEDMGRMYKLVERTEFGLKDMQDILEKHITKMGLEAIESCGDMTNIEPQTYVKAILDVHKKYNALVIIAFNSNPMFRTALDKALEKFINDNAVTRVAKNGNKSPELVARYCDFLLKKSSKILGDDELDDVLSSIMIVFKYLEAKDVFQKFYSNMLAKRLVEHISTSDDAERSMISKLKEACGAMYTSKLQKMFQDVEVNKTLNDRFKDHQQQLHGSTPVDFNVEVLTAGSWPFNLISTFALPAELETCIQRFTAFYSAQHSGRKLSWLYHKSRADIQTTCFKKRYTLLASTYQVAVLLQYNYALKYTVQQLQDNTQISMMELQQVLKTLHKTKLLLCGNSAADDEKEFDDSALFELYQDYNNRKLRININIPLKTEAKQEQEETHRTVEADRRYLIEAVIVRIMKDKKTFKHQELISETILQLKARFKPDIHGIKKSIDDLIARDYLERADGQQDVYNYLA